MSKTRQQVQAEHQFVTEEFIVKICRQQSEIIGKQIDEKMRRIEDAVKSMVSEIKSNTSKIVQLEAKVSELEQRYKQNNVIVVGISESDNESSEDIEDKVRRLFQNKLGIEVAASDIVKCFRIGKHKQGKPRSILISFLSVKMKNNVYRQKKLLKGTGYSLREDLTIANVELMKKAVSKYGFTNVWSQDGKIFALYQNNKISIKSSDDLEM